MSSRDGRNLVDDSRTARLCDVGQPEYIAATVVTGDGTNHLVLARSDALGDPNVPYHPDCLDAPHEQLGPLPARYTQHLVATRRIHLCGRPTKSGCPCRTPVARAGQVCAWHRIPNTTEEAW